MKASAVLHLATSILVQGLVQACNRTAPPLPASGVDETPWIFKFPFGKRMFNNETVQDIETNNENIGIMPLDELNLAKDTMPVEFCGFYPMVNGHHLSAQVPSVMAISGPAVVGKGPGDDFAQVSCPGDSTVWWCSDCFYPFTLSQLARFRDAKATIIVECCITTNCQGSSDFPVSEPAFGQAFLDEGGKVLVKEGC